MQTNHEETTLKEFRTELFHPIKKVPYTYYFKYSDKYIIFGDILIYDLDKKEFQTQYLTPAKQYNINNIPHYYIESGVAYSIIALNNIINNLTHSSRVS